MRNRFGLVALAAVATAGMLASCGGTVSRAASDGAPTTSSHGRPSASSSPLSPSSGRSPASSSSSSARSATATASRPPQAPSTRAPPVTVVATLHGAVPASVTPGAPPVAQVPASWYGYPSVLPVIATAPGWVEVREAQRPNESTAWVPAADVTLSSDPYYIVVRLATTHLQVFFNGNLVQDLPIGVGAAATPTVTGSFFVAMKAPPPSAGYGPFVLVTSAHSNTITDWEGTGDAIVAIHGPINATADSRIGTTGARLSNGCIRLHDADLARLANVPAGTPVDIVN